MTSMDDARVQPRSNRAMRRLPLFALTFSVAFHLALLLLVDIESWVRRPSPKLPTPTLTLVYPAEVTAAPKSEELPVASPVKAPEPRPQTPQVAPSVGRAQPATQHNLAPKPKLSSTPAPQGPFDPRLRQQLQSLSRDRYTPPIDEISGYRDNGGNEWIINGDKCMRIVRAHDHHDQDRLTLPARCSFKASPEDKFEQSFRQALKARGFN